MKHFYRLDAHLAVTVTPAHPVKTALKRNECYSRCASIDRHHCTVLADCFKTRAPMVATVACGEIASRSGPAHRKRVTLHEIMRVAHISGVVMRPEWQLGRFSCPIRHAKCPTLPVRVKRPSGADRLRSRPDPTNRAPTR